MEAMMDSIETNGNEIAYRRTPWDERVFELETIEILGIDYRDEEGVMELLYQLEEHIDSNGLIYFRNDSRDIVLKKIMLANNYYVSESSLELSHGKVQRCDFGNVYRNDLKLINTVSENNVGELKEIAVTAFNFSRFHEDPFLDVSKSRKRYEYWIDDLIEQKKKVLLYIKGDELVSFMFYEYVNEKKVDLILGGSKNGYGIMTPFFLSSVLSYLKDSGVKVVDVVISAANIQIFNMYINLGFQIKKPMLDYHKIIEKAG
jgi:hypothetical protein